MMQDYFSALEKNKQYKSATKTSRNHEPQIDYDNSSSAEQKSIYDQLEELHQNRMKAALPKLAFPNLTNQDSLRFMQKTKSKASLFGKHVPKLG